MICCCETESYRCKLLKYISVLTCVVVFYVITYPVKEYQPLIIKDILDKQLKLPDLGDNSRDTDSHGIPRIFHQMWMDENIPLRYVKNVNHL